MAWAPDADYWRHRPVVVTGAAGFLGSHLTAKLVELDSAVTVMVRSPVPATPITTWTDSVEVVIGPVEDQDLFEQVLTERGIKTVFHCAAQSQVGVAMKDPASTWSTNILGTCTMLEAARRYGGTEQIVTASSDKAYGSQVVPYTEDMPLLAENPYDVSKACADLVAQSYFYTWGLPVCITRCANLFGLGDLNWARLVPGVIRALLDNEQPIIRSDGTLIRDYLYVLDSVLAYLLLSEAMADDQSLWGEAFNFSPEEQLNVIEMVTALERVMGSDIGPKILGTASHEIPVTHLSSAKARKLLHWAPQWTLEEALAETVVWYRDYLRRD